MADRYKTIIVIGNVATGKSTLTNFLVETLPARAVPADELYKTDPFFPLALEDRKRWSFTNDLSFLYERIKIMRALQQSQKEEHLIIDGGLLMSYVYASSRVESGTMTPDEWKLYEALYEEFTKDLMKPDLVIFLTCPVTISRQRILKRGRKFEIAKHTELYLEGLEKSLAAFENKLQKQKSIYLKIDTSQDDFSLENVTNLVKKNI
jgi:deoxyadenosine/deoxycytidine kinase